MEEERKSTGGFEGSIILSIRQRRLEMNSLKCHRIFPMMSKDYGKGFMALGLAEDELESREEYLEFKIEKRILYDDMGNRLASMFSIVNMVIAWKNLDGYTEKYFS
jgi:hypothetical protein